MKKLIKLFCITSILVVSCGETELNIEGKKTKLKELKSQLTDIKSQIKELENELNMQFDDNKQKKVPVRIKELEKELFYHFIEQSGKINSNENVLVSAEMGGLITHINTKEGQWVAEKKTRNSKAQIEFAQKDVGDVSDDAHASPYIIPTPPTILQEQEVEEIFTKFSGKRRDAREIL